MVDADRFEAEYCPPIDTALYSAIISDFDLSTEDGIAAARATLDPLKESAEIEDAAGFDASGVGSHDVNDSVERSSRQDQSVFDSENVSQITDDSSLSRRFSPLNISNDETSSEQDNDMDEFDEETKILLLHEVFGEQVSSNTIKAALHRSDGRWHSAMEDLLNQVFFIIDDAESRSMIKGIDGFAINESSESKNKRKRNRQKNRDLSRLPTQQDTNLPSKWDQGQKDVEFLSSALHLDRAIVKSAYNKNDRSMPRTINDLLKQDARQHADQPASPEVNKLIHDLAVEYALSPAVCTAIAHATKSSIVPAHEIASVLTASSRSTNTTIIPQYAAPKDVSIEDSTWQTVVPKKKGTTALVFSGTYDGQAQLIAARKTRAFEQARAAHRKARSDPNWAGVAGYYSQVGHGYSTQMHSAIAASADMLADMQSSASQVDLHGVDVVNGSRIAQERVEAWWHSTAEQRASGRGGGAYTIVVGRGTHSEGGKSKLGPSISKMLKSKGWRFTHEGAVIVVKGKQR